MSRYVLGLDFGSDSVRALVIDTADGKELGSGSAVYPRWSKGLYCDPSCQQFRQHPKDHLEAMTTAVQTALSKSGRDAAKAICAIGIDTTGSSPLPVDANGTALALLPEFAENPDAMCVLWKDHTAHKEAEAINALAHGGKYRDYTAFSGGIYSSEWFWAKIWHVAAGNARVRKAAFSWVEHCDWIPAVLTGTTAPATMKRGRCSAGHKAMWNASWGGLPDATFLAALHPYLGQLRSNLYSETATVDQVAGTLTAEWAKNFGLPEGIPVAVGAFDAHLGAVGAGAGPNVLVKVMGTSTCDMVVAKPQDLGKKQIPGICGQVDGSIVPGLIGLEAGQSAFGDCFAWLRDLAAWPLKQSLKKRPASCQEHIQEVIDGILPALDQAAAALPPGITGELAIDWLNGRRTPDASAAARGALTGLHLGSDLPAVYRSLVEATAFGARAIVERITDSGVPITRVVGIGGIAVKSPLVMQIHADVLNRPIGVVRSTQCCALGAGIAAAVAAGIHPSILAAQKAMASPITATYRPNRAAARNYNSLYARYLKVGALLDESKGSK